MTLPRMPETAIQYTVKTPSWPQPQPSPPPSQPNRSSKPSTPTLTPPGCLPYSVGQPYPPKLSPGRHLAVDMRTPSPNYFALSIEPSTELRDSAAVPKDNWSGHSSVKSFAAANPKPLHVDANSDFENFKRQADSNWGLRTFSLGTSQLALPATKTTTKATPAAVSRPRPSWWPGSDMSQRLMAKKYAVSSGVGRLDGESGNVVDLAHVSGESKRNLDLSTRLGAILNAPRFESPAQLESPFDHVNRSTLSRVDDRHPRLSLIQNKIDPPAPNTDALPHADTLPVMPMTASPSMMSPEDLKAMLLLPTAKSDLLVLDLRVSPRYAVSRIRGALNLCIPTTLLKRATFNLEKLKHTFQSERDQDEFSRWRATRYLVVYDAFSAEKGDAQSALNTIKKFTNEGYAGSTFILRGGFNAFAALYPDMVDCQTNSSRSQTSLHSSFGLFHTQQQQRRHQPTTAGGSTNDDVVGAAVIGGVMLPPDASKPNPFFANIRQNMDLADGVGQMEITAPQGLERAKLPRWLAQAAKYDDHGKSIADKFLNIERVEQSRMQMAYSIVVDSAGTLDSTTPIRLSGIEIGAKNRYKDILPFEHARVRLAGKNPDGGSDYVNASHIKASRSNKRYIATQGPLPATFDDFWSVIWDQDVRVVVMLTAESEAGQLKCHPYWRSNDYGPIRLRLLSEKRVSLDLDKHRSSSTVGALMADQQNANVSTALVPNTSAPPQPQPRTASDAFLRRRANTMTGFDDQQSSQSTPDNQSTVVLRKFALSHTAYPFLPMREITHLHYSSWTDFGTPAKPSHLLALVELANAIQYAAVPLDRTVSNSNFGGGNTVASSARLGPTSTTSGGGGSSGVVTSTVSGEPTAPFESAASSTSTAGTATSTTATVDGTWASRRWIASDELFDNGPEQDPHARPMLVHCSAGCGRTGTFCTVDSVLDMLKRQLAATGGNFASCDSGGGDDIAGVNDDEIASASQQDLDGDVTMMELEERPISSFKADNAMLSPGALQSLPAPCFDSAKADGTLVAESVDATADEQQDRCGETIRSLGSKDGTLTSTTSAAVTAPMDKDHNNCTDLSWIADESIDLIEKTVHDFRRQRLSMVQGLRQYVLCYEAVLEWLARRQQQQRQQYNGRRRRNSEAAASTTPQPILRP